MTDKIVIRKAKDEERFVLSALSMRSKAFWGYSPEFMDSFRAELAISNKDIANPNRHYILAESEGKILGYYALERISSDEYELEALFVEPKYIGQGIGRRLIEHAKYQARRAGARFMLIQGDPNAKGFYCAAGGIQIGERESDSIPGRYLPEFRISLKDEKLAHNAYKKTQQEYLKKPFKDKNRV